jgi:low density lipoprotein-related protein 2
MQNFIPLITKVLFELDSFTGYIESLAYDWVNGMLYYSYSDPPLNFIKVTRYPNSLDSHLTIFKSKTDTPVVIAVNPKLKYLYWIVQGQFAKLERSNLDGSNRTTLISAEILSPTDLYVEPRSGDVYWSDNIKDRVEKCDWDGKNRVVVKQTQMPNPKSIFVYEGQLFYGDLRQRSVFSYNMSYTNNTSLLLKKLRGQMWADLQEVVVFSEKSQPIDGVSSSCGGLVAANQCDQYCFSLPNTPVAKCACAIGELDSNGHSCRQPREYLIYSMETEIRSVNLPSGTNDPHTTANTVPWRPVDGFSRAIGIDFDYRDNKIIFGDIVAKKVGSFPVGVENPSITDIIKNTNGSSPYSPSAYLRRVIGKPEGVSYDWVSDTVYYADSEMSQIVSYKISTGMKLVLMFSESPRAIVVHPCKGYVYWTDVGRLPMIARTTLSGSNFERIVTTDLKWPNGLTIDFDNDKLYWVK